MKLSLLNASLVTLATKNQRTPSARQSNCWRHLRETKKTRLEEEEAPPNFFGIPLDDGGLDESSSDLETQRFRIVGVLNTEIKEGAGQGGLRGLMPGAGVYVPLQLRTTGAVNIVDQ